MEKTKNKKTLKLATYLILALAILSSMIVGTKSFLKSSFGSDAKEITIEARLDKYINYNLSEEEFSTKNGTLLQYQIKQNIKQEENKQEIEKTELKIQLNEIDGKTPEQVKIIEKQTGKQKEIQYNKNERTIQIEENNQNETNEYILMCYYDTYTENTPTRELELNIETSITLSSENSAIINAQKSFKIEVSENIGKLTSIRYQTEDIYNGYIKSNQINGTNYETNYQDKQTITISQKQRQDNLQIKETNTIIKEDQTIENNQQLTYKNTKINKNNLQSLLGEEGTLEILDKDQNQIAIINNETQWEENGNYTINYENEPEEITIKTSKIQSEGILILEHTKTIKSTYQEAENTKIKTTTNIIGTKEEQEQQTEIYNETHENEKEIKQATTNINTQLNQNQWTNEQQNEITFDISIKTNEAKDNLLKDPEIKIELPSEVEKVILQNNSIFYGNGIEIKEVYTRTNENGRIEIIANLEGAQTQYSEDTLDLTTDIKILATIILKKDIESTNTTAILNYLNKYTTSQNEEIKQEIPLTINNYQEEQTEEQTEEPTQNYQTANPTDKSQDQQNLKLEVAPIKGDITLNDKDTIYEAEYIKYNIKITNTSNEKLENIKIIGNIPEGTTYGELDADYHTFSGKYEYKFDENKKTIEIPIENLEAGQSTTTYYEVKTNYLEEGQTQKETTLNLDTYIGETQVATYSQTNTIKKSETGVFLGVSPYVNKDQWFYTLQLQGEKEIVDETKLDEETGEEVPVKDMNNYKPVNVTIKFPKEYTPTVMDLKKGYGDNITISKDDIAEDGSITLTLYTNSTYLFDGNVDRSKIQETPKSETELIAIATVEKDGITYKSNENRMLYTYESVSVTMTSNNEGEEINCDDEIEYEVKITNTGKSNLNNMVNSRIYVNISDYIPKELKPISASYEIWQEVNENKPSIDDITSLDPDVVENEGGNGNDQTLPSDTEVEYKNDGFTTTYLSAGNSPTLELQDIMIPYGKTMNLKIKAQARKVDEKTKVENNIEITGESISSKTSNTITHTILPKKDEPENPDKPIDPENPDNPNKPEEPDNPSKPTDPEEPGEPENPDDQTYSIEGIAWLDENEDGIRQEEEKRISEIPVMLVSAEDNDKIKETIKTNNKGEYKFSNLKQGNYIVLFQYDTNTYHITQYQKNEATNETNSDAISKEFDVNGKTTTVGIIDASNLKTSKTNMDIGLIENKIRNLKLDKYISKVSVTTKAGTKQYAYNNEKLSKIEIKAKEIAGATVVIEYKIKITNKGEVQTTIGKVIDNLPNELTFSSELNKQWSKTSNGEIINKTLEKQKLKPEESAELTLIATKKMTAENTGNFINKAKIDIEDENQKDNTSEAEVIISISTGAIIYISIGISTIIMIGIAILLIKKKIKSKSIIISIFTGLLVTSIIGITQIDSIAAYYESTYPKTLIQTGSYTSSQEVAEETTFNWVPDSPIKNQFGSIFFSGGPGGDGGYCTNPGRVAYSGTYIKGSTSVKSTKKDVHEDDISFTLKAEGIPITFNATEDTYTYGPMTLVSTADCDKCIIDYGCGTMPLSVKKGNNTFSITIPASQGPITSVTATVTKYGKRTEVIYEYGDITWVPKNSSYTYYTYESYTTTDSNGNTVTHTKKIAHNGTFQNVVTHNNLIRKTVKVYQISNTQTCTWTPSNTSILLKKEDYDNPNKAMQNVTFDGPKGGGTTGADGKFFIQDLPSSVTYTLNEIKNPNYGYDHPDYPKSTGSVYGKPGELSRLTVKNIKHTGNLKIIKKDIDNNQIKLHNMGFKLINSRGYYLIAVDDNGKVQKTPEGRIFLGNLQYTKDASQATEFRTDKNGIIEIINLLTGDYTVEETSVGAYEGYDVDDKYIFWENDSKKSGTTRYAKVTVTRQTSLNTERPTMKTLYCNTLTIKNRRKYLKISGKTWHDVEDNGKTDQDRNALYGDINDRPIAGLTVQLIDMRTGKVVKHDRTGKLFETKTATDGSYIFEDVMIDELKYYKVEFQYNGMSYQNVKSRADTYPLQYAEITGHDKQEKKSRAEVKNSNRVDEGTNRDDFNNAYSTISIGKSNKYELTYKELDHESQILFRKDKNEKLYNYGYKGGEEDRGPVSGVDEQYIIRANTCNTYSNGVTTDGGLTKIKTEAEIRKNAILEIADINLGLEKRIKTDLSLTKDLNNIKLSINNEIHTYNYADRFNKDLWPDGGYDIRPQVKFGGKYGSMSYSRAVYASDVYYKEGEEDDQLRVKVTYKIGIKNYSDSLTSIVNEIEDYYNIKYYNIGEKIKIGKQIDQNGDIIGTELEKENITDSGNNEYYKMKIKNINLKIDPQKDECIYVQLEVKQDQIIHLLEEGTKIDNYAEISSYSTKDKEGKAYAAIDRDSQPGRLKIGDEKTYEDDTDRAPGLQLILQEERKLEGNVFIDYTEGKLKTGEIREADGEYKENEKDSKVAEVDVKLVKTNGNKPGEIAEKYTGTNSNGKWEEAKTKTDENGHYYIGGFIPGDYMVIYTWGGQTYIDPDNGKSELIRVQDYKGTIYKDENRQTNQEWYKAREPRYSDAMDNYEQRVEIDKQSEITTNHNTHVITDYKDGMLQIEGDEAGEKLITKIESITPKFKVNLEYDIKPNHYTEEYDIEEDGKLKMNGLYIVKQEPFQNHLQNVDFGIVKRAKQAVKLEKRISRVKLILANGVVLIDGRIEEVDGKRQLIDQVKYTTYMMPSNGGNGNIKFEIDSELAHGARLETYYEIAATNISEIDYLTEQYYHYGKGHGEEENKIVRINVLDIVDYLDKNLTTDNKETNIKGEILETEESRNQLIEDGLLENTEEMKNWLNNRARTILKIKGLEDKQLTPIKTKETETTASITMETSKLLADNDELLNPNEAEIIKTHKTGGATLTTILGNYIPNASLEKETDTSTSEEIVVIPPTGITKEEANNNTYIILAIAMGSMLACGITIIIKIMKK